MTRVRTFLSLVTIIALLGLTVFTQQQGTPSVLRVRTDANGYLVTASATQTLPITTSVFSNTRLRTDASGNLLITVASGPIAATTITFSGGNILDGTQTNRLIDRNGTNAKRFDVAKTWTDINNNEIISLDAGQTSTGVNLIGSRTLGTGLARTTIFHAQADAGSNTYIGMVAQANNTPRVRFGFFTNTGAPSTLAVSGAMIDLAAYTNTQASGSVQQVIIQPTYNQTAATTANTDFLINRTETAVGSGNQFLLDAQVGGASKFLVSNTGVIQVVNSAVWQWNGRNKFTSNGDGLTNILSSSGSVGAQFNVGTADVTVTSCGTGTVTAGSRNTGGEITATGATACTVTFSGSWTNTPFCVATEVTAARALFVSASSTSSFTVSGLTAGDVFKYVCIGRI